MSIVSSIRDYVEFLNTLSDSLGNELTSSKLITESFLYFLKTLQYSVYYIFTLQWLHDFTLLPVTIPQISHAIFSENLFLEVKNPSKIFFEFLEIPSLNQNKFFLGFFNSFFLTLPITVTHLIAFRRLIIQGVPAAIFSIAGFIIGQTLFIFCVTFGIRGILIPWFSLEPFNYILGLILIFHIIYGMVGENLIQLKWNNALNRKIFTKFFIFNFILAWCEQSCIFQYISNITLSSYPTILEGFSTKTTLASFFSHSNYILGILVGSLVFSSFWGFFIWQIKNFIVGFTGISLTTFVQTVNKATFVIVLGFTLSSIPFYGLDYLFTGPLGFISGDNVFKNTMLSQYRIPESKANIMQYAADPSEKYLNIDSSPFDRGRYLLSPDFYSFEDLNYRGEADWVIRREKQSTISDSRGGFLSITKIFKKQKTNQPDAINQASSPELNKYFTYNSLVEQENTDRLERSQIEDRFYNWYGFKEVEAADQEDAEDEVFKQNFKNFNLAFYSPQMFETQDNRLEVDIEKKIKQKYYSNPIYSTLLALDIDLFLNRQPKSSFLGKEAEIDLYQKRQMLTSYYDSLRFYSKLPESEFFENFFDGTKSFTNKVYNQQFKGTLQTVRRLFSLHTESGFDLKNPSKFDENDLKQKTLDSVLKYDQPLYESQNKFSSYHEELPEIGFFERDKKPSKDIKPKSISNSDASLKASVLGEMITKPMYAGWDENLRKFIITNKLLPQSVAGYEMTIPQEFYNKFKSEKQINTKLHSSKNNFGEREKIYFSSWPKTEADFLKPIVPFVSLFDPKIDQTNYPIFDDSLRQKYKSFPSNYKIVQQIFGKNEELKTDSSGEELMPKRGGFVWPGNFSFNFKTIFK